ncbi:MAG: hypothetical protein WC329_04575 [Candidatus Omnitrophota bacterium]|jgi:hypothetical protein
MKTTIPFFCFILISSLLCPVQPAAAENNTKQPAAGAPAKDVQIQVSGKVSVEKMQNNKDRIWFTDLQGKSYRLSGELSGELKDKFAELGENNLFSLKITPDGKYSLSCEKTQTYVFNNKNERTLQIDAKCIRAYFAGIDAILSAKRSDKPGPEPIRDIVEERNLIASASSQKPGIIPFTTGEIYGKISAMDLNSPFKTLTVTNRNSSEALKKISAVITQNTRIVKKIGAAEPIILLPNALSVGQEVTVVYARDELKNEALFITITKE